MKINIIIRLQIDLNQIMVTENCSKASWQCDCIFLK